MEMKKNRHTLRKRIRRAIFLSVFTTVIFFCGIIIYVGTELFRTQAVYVSNYFSYSISETMNSKLFLKQLNINSLKDLDPESPDAGEWFKNLESSIRNSNVPDLDIVPGKLGTDSHPLPEITVEGIKDNDVKFLIKPQDLVYIKIDLNGKTVFTNDRFDEESLLSYLNRFKNTDKHSELVQKLLNYYNTESVHSLYADDGSDIGNVTVKINEGFILVIFTTLVVSIVVTGFLLLLLARILSRFLVIPITSPLNTLEEKMHALAAGDYESTINARIIIKKPLEEVESLADSTNKIMHKMREYNDILAEQKEALENQNHELEAQNEELANSKKQIQEAQTLLVQREQMASIGQLTAAIAHEINTPLGAINSNVQLCDMFLNILDSSQMIHTDTELENTVVQMKEANSINLLACRRVSEIIKSLKSFSKIDQAEFQEADINEGIKSVLVLTSNLWKRKIEIHRDFADLPAVKCFPGLLNQVFMNIVVNAIQSIEEKGDIYIKTYTDCESVYISIKDNGCGIAEENIQRIFEPGFSTKGIGIGMGLGLSICRNIIDRHKGEIKVNSEPGKGTEFLIRIPLNVGNPAI